MEGRMERDRGDPQPQAARLPWRTGSAIGERPLTGMGGLRRRRPAARLRAGKRERKVWVVAVAVEGG